MNLATAQRIVTIAPIEGADAIEKATVLGWDVVVKKGEYKQGDLATYIQIDTVAPEKPEFEFLRERKFRVRTIKLRGQISQGLIVPLPQGRFSEGDDLTEIIGVKKYEKPQIGYYEKERKPITWFEKITYRLKNQYLYRWFPFLRTKGRLSFPTNIVSITDEERIQNMPQMLEKYRGKSFVVSEKLDGSSITIIHEKKWTGSHYRVCSRRFELLDKKNEFYKVFKSTEFERHIQKIIAVYKTNDIVVQGEFIGDPQGNRYQVPNQIRLFNIQVKGKRLNQREFYQVCVSNSIPCCPFITNIDLDFTLSEILTYAEGKSVINSQIEREGIVFRCIEDNFSFKVISNKFLVLNNE